MHIINDKATGFQLSQHSLEARWAVYLVPIF